MTPETPVAQLDLSEEIKAFLQVRDNRLRGRKFKPSFLQKLFNDGFDLPFQ